MCVFSGAGVEAVEKKEEDGMDVHVEGKEGRARTLTCASKKIANLQTSLS